ncbi:OmpA-like transmembrane domain protein [hydrothermal vent metagenome]|uniref:OmpA-like transmembrane domain protein n=1 Tax=hydrothermal vent metagenome TaxID=652676 RepID=A0A1W1E6L2_9ZZZZ
MPTPTIDNINFTNENNSPKVNINFSSVVGADSYIIQKGLDGNYEDITTTNTIFIDSNVEHAKKYTYKIFAKTNKFYSSPSSEVEVNTGYIFKSIGSENGLILENNCTNRCNSIYVPNSDIKLKAIANNGYKFNNWSGNCSGNANPLTITMNANKVCSAVFSLLVIGDQYIVNVSTTNGNINSNPSGINCGSDCDEVFNKNTVVSLTATPNSGYEFTDWGGSCSGNANPLTITINNNKSCAANFTLLNVDTDNDGHPDNQDAFPNDPNEWLDTDGDGTGNNADTDDDNDGMSDTWETVYGLNPLVDDSTGDLDNDGFTNLEEYQASTNPTDGADKPINYQQVYIQDNNKKINSGQNISLFVKYKTSDNDNTVSGLGMRIHYDASKLEQISITDIFGTPIGISSESENDGLTDYDNDSSTNRYYGIAWASVNSNWPNQRLPLDLFKFNFKVKDGLSVGEQTRLNFSSTSLSNGYTFQPTNSVLTVTNVTLDIDGDGSSDALTDGLLTLRYLFGFQDNTLIHNAIGANALRVSAANVKAFLDQNKLLLLDVDGNGSADALTDGLLILRYLFGFKDNTLINNAIGNGATRTTADEIKTYLQSVDL